MKNGECKFGENCKFHHPIDRFEKTRRPSQEQNVKLTLAGLPRREVLLNYIMCFWKTPHVLYILFSSLPEWYISDIWF